MAIAKETPASKWIVLFSSLLLMTLCLGFNFTSMSMMLPVWQAEFGFSATQYGLLAGAISMGGMVIVFIAGNIFDKFNLKAVLYSAVILNGLAVSLRMVITSFETAYFMLFLSGLFANIVYAGLIKSLAAWFDRKALLKANGILTSGGSIGFFLGFNVTSPWSEALGGWDKLFLWQGVVMVAFGLICFLIVPLREEKQGAMNLDLKVQTEGYTVGRRLKELLTSKQVILILISEFLIAGSLLTFSSVGPAAFMGTWENIDATKLGLILSFVNVGSVFGYWILPPLAVKVGLRKIMSLPFVVFTCAVFAASLLTHNFMVAVVLNMLGGFSNGLGLMAGRILLLEHPDVAGVKAGTASGLLLTLNKLGCVFFPVFYTTVASSFGIYPAWIAMFVLGAVGIVPLLFTQDTGTKAVARRQAKQQAEDSPA
ncbi:MAG: MFS transporter [Clostridiales Family XIII bacterium]|jgi:MFS family permease|nr:MFS transporter [Clostridiales Family XIII bacterium]